MPKWQNKPPTDHQNFALRIIRTPQAKPIAAYVTSTDINGCPTHYARNRTLPCEGEDECPHCQEGLSWRWHGYLAAILTETLEHFIFEFTATAAETFENYLLLHNTMRGCFFKAHRPSGRANGRVVIQAKPGDQERIRLPNPPNVEKILCHIWNVPYLTGQTVYNPERPGKQIRIHKRNGNPDPKPAA